MTPEQGFGRILKSLRQQRGLSQGALADKFGSHRTYISFLERGQRSPTLGSVFAIAEALEVKPSEIIHLVESEMRSSTYET
jgi:transcriptional regulator with XRE-family HTH domain